MGVIRGRSSGNLWGPGFWLSLRYFQTVAGSAPCDDLLMAAEMEGSAAQQAAPHHGDAVPLWCRQE